jgi:TRAP-type mannitol/chloroaromatic compound transport system permease small subunit
MSIISWFNAVGDRISKVFLVAATVSLFVLLLISTGNSFGRYFLGNPIEETISIIQLYLLPGLIVLSMSHVLKEEGNVAVDLMYRNFSDRQQTLVDLLGYIGVLIVFVLILHSVTLQSYDYTLRRTQQASGFPTYVSWWIVTLGVAVFCYNLIIEIGREVGDLYCE